MDGRELAEYMVRKGQASMKRAVRIGSSRKLFPMLYRLKDSMFPDFERDMWFSLFKQNINLASKRGSPTLVRFAAVLNHTRADRVFQAIGLAVHRWGRDDVLNVLTEVLEYQWGRGHEPIPIYMKGEAEENLGRLLDIMHELNRDSFDEMGRLNIMPPEMVTHYHRSLLG